MTDPEMADVTYVEPHTNVRRASDRSGTSDAILATVGGQTALNLAMELTNKAY